MVYLHHMVKKKYVNRLVKVGYDKESAERFIDDCDKEMEKDLMKNLKKLEQSASYLKKEKTLLENA